MQHAFADGVGGREKGVDFRDVSHHGAPHGGRGGVNEETLAVFKRHEVFLRREDWGERVREAEIVVVVIITIFPRSLCPAFLFLA